MKDMETSKELFNLYLDNMDVFCKALVHIIPTVWKFDGKVYNARFDNAITKALEEYESDLGQRIWTHIELGLSQFKMELHATKRSIKGKNAWEYLPSCYDEERIYIYSDYNTWNTLDEKSKSYYGNVTEGATHYFYIDENYNNRIKSKAIVDAIEQKIKDIKAEKEKMLEEIQHIEEYRAEAEELKQKMEKLHNRIPHCFTTFFDLKTYATYN